MKAEVWLNAVVKKIVLALLMLSLVTGYSVTARGNDTVLKDAVNHADNLVRLTMDYKIHVTGTTDRLRLVTLIPKTIENKQKVIGINYSIPPTRFFEMSGNQYAEYVLTDLRSDVDIRINADMALRRFDLSSACPLVAKDTTTCDFLKSERYLEKDDPRIVAVANAIGGKDEIDIIRNVYNYVTSHIVYKGYVPEDEGAVKVLFERGYGDCSDFSDSLAALARAKNIPARDVDGFLTSYGGDNPCHTWVEIYTDKYGWVPFDPLLGNLKQARFDRLAPQYIYLSDLRNDPTLDGFHFFACSYEGSPVNVSSTYSIKTNATNVMTLTRN